MTELMLTRSAWARALRDATTARSASPRLCGASEPISGGCVRICGGRGGIVEMQATPAASGRTPGEVKR